MNQETNYLNVLGYSTRVTADKKIIDLIRYNAGFVLPDLFVQDFRRGRGIGSIAAKASGNNEFLDSGNKEYLVSGNYGDKQLTMDTVMISSRLLEDSLVKDGRYSFHSSAVSDGRDVIIIGGSASSGKTTTALCACLNAPDKIKVYSGDRTVLEGQKTLGGSKDFSIRLGTVTYEIPKLREYISEHNTDCPWDTATIVSPEKIKLDVDYGPRNIKCFVYPRKGNHDLEVSSIKDDRAILRLHEDACVFSDVYPTIVLGQRKTMMDSEISREERQERLDYVVSLTRQVPIMSASGRLDDIARYVTELMLDKA